MKNDNDTRLCVVIPVHRPQLTTDEAVSLSACKTHLAGYDCFLVFPRGMDTAAYTARHPELLLKPVPPEWLSSIERYNKMKTSLAFYELFSAYTHLMTYELDAFIFSADLEEAHAFTFDYIGAPFFEGYWKIAPDAPFIPGGNSGFSVRNIQACVRALRGMKKYYMHWLLYRLLFTPSLRFKLWFNEYTAYKYDVWVSGKVGFHFSDLHFNEDLIWSQVMPQLFPWFRVSDPMCAMKFSFEYNPEKLLRLNGGRLPLGCHAWAKHPDFWKRYINAAYEV